MEDEAEPVRILFVFAWLVVGGEETEVRLLAEHLDPARYRIEVVACFRKEGMPEQTHRQLEALGVPVDRTPYALSFEDTVSYLAGKLPAYDIVVSCQNVADIYPALERLHFRPPLIEHGGLVSEALGGPKHLTARYVGVCRTIRDAAAARMPGREAHALEIPSMVDLGPFDRASRTAARQALGLAPQTPLVGWLGRLDPKKRVEDFIAAAALVHAARPDARFLVIGGADAFLPHYEAELKARAKLHGLDGALVFLGDRADVPELLAALDVFVWLSRGEGMPHVIAEAGAARLPVIATPDNGALEQIADGETGLFVPHEDPAATAAAISRLLADPALRRRLGEALRAKVVRDYAVEAVVPQWEALFADVLAERGSNRSAPRLFSSFFHGGFESSSHRRAHDRRRVDMIAATDHDRHAESDYRALAGHGILTVRDGLRWHLIERSPGVYDWSSLMDQLRAAEATGTEVVWDILHYGWPDDLDIWRPDFVTRFATFARAAAEVIAARTSGAPIFAPVNEISFFAWGGGDAGYLNPFANGRGHELKVQLCRAAIAAMEAILAVVPGGRFVHADPVINVICDPGRPGDAPHAEGHRQAQFQAWDMIAGRSWPQIGGCEALLDIVGVNYYFNNQWIHGGPPIDLGHPLYKPFRRILAETYARYGRPIFVAETGIEAERRPAWLAYVCAEVRAAMRSGVPVEGICLYPVLDHPGWDDERYCPNGLLQFEKGEGRRTAYAPLAAELQRQRRLFEAETGAAKRGA
ncbi:MULTISPECIES: glycosyltransferase family 4 protein [unclassified Aureimonas]|uniref:glycosyltransferase family 4 protein n=1 Tax=unclassified Aureimonas TaxID=2615206 RepID=UPI0007008402|nr:MULTISPECIES: glycosyltransferase family 4 protein [unclassified Aureimonas]KQT57351.1 glycosyl transferase family 1 [Aureimonas sp. Leaf427]KQT77029.1 glycosyl transferase family 1 [Aureimonas sp. Leaf460]